MVRSRIIAGLALLGSFLSALVALGVVDVQPASPVGVSIPAQAHGGHVESAVWAYNPAEDEFHFEMTVGMSRYAMLVSFGSAKLESARGAFETNAFRMGVDVSDLRLAYPMAYHDKVYVLRDVYCEGYLPRPQVLVAIIGAIVGFPTNIVGAILGSSIDKWLMDAEYRAYVVDAYERCVQHYVQPGGAIEDYALYYGALLEKTSLWLGPIQLPVEVEVPRPVIYGYVVEAYPAYRPASDGPFPFGKIKVWLQNREGRRYDATISIGLSDVRDMNRGTFTGVCGRFSGVDGSVCYSYYAYSMPRLRKGEPVLYKEPGSGYKLTWSSQLWRYESTFRSALSSLRNVLPDRLRVSSASAQFDLPTNAGYSVEQVAEITRVALEKLDSTVKTLGSAYRDLLSPDSYEVKEVYGSLLLVLNENPVELGRFKLVLSGDISADAIGLVRLTPEPSIVSVTRRVEVPRDGPAQITVQVRNGSGQAGQIQFTLSCRELSVAGFPQTRSISGRGTETYTLSFTAKPRGGENRLIEDTCTLYVSDLDKTFVDRRSVVLIYKPEVYCNKGSYWCDVNHAGYYYCQDPYKPKEEQPYTPCPEGHVCKIDLSTGQAKCVPEGGDGDRDRDGDGDGDGRVVGRYCKDSQICYVYDDGSVKCEPCPEGETCIVVAGEGARCSGDVVPPPPPPPPPGGVVVMPEETGESVRLGAGILSIALAWLAVILW